MQINRKWTYICILVAIVTIAAACGRQQQMFLKSINEGDVEPITQFLNSGGNPNLIVLEDSRQTMVSFAAGQGKLNIVKLLVESGADINHTNRYGNTPLFFAVSSGDIATVSYLISKGAEPGHEDNLGITLYKCSFNLPKSNVSVMIDALNRSYPIDKLNSNTRVILLEYAVQVNCETAFRKLIKIIREINSVSSKEIEKIDLIESKVRFF